MQIDVYLARIVSIQGALGTFEAFPPIFQHEHVDQPDQKRWGAVGPRIIAHWYPAMTGRKHDPLVEDGEA